MDLHAHIHSHMIKVYESSLSLSLSLSLSNLHTHRPIFKPSRPTSDVPSCSSEEEDDKLLILQAPTNLRLVPIPAREKGETGGFWKDHRRHQWAPQGSLHGSPCTHTLTHDQGV
eukprot:TRINITY_DN41721_c0_g1_i1.p1 TRINITY_DN41721_c0_g1~~TRINITY_DN41721_c0_g1_i1.p1  ORF type:complete len:114 (+),score=21.71 TRINITY_DN41721_c0_g1_i1:117-458(+)